MCQTWHIADAMMRSSITGCDVSDTRATDNPASQICVKIVQCGRQLCAKRKSQVGQESDVDFQAVLLGEQIWSKYRTT